MYSTTVRNPEKTWVREYSDTDILDVHYIKHADMFLAFTCQSTFTPHVIVLLITLLWIAGRAAGLASPHPLTIIILIVEYEG